MKNQNLITKENNKKGITLVALIITVIVLLILAMVSISLVINSGIINKAKYGVDKYSEEEELEQIKLAVASARLKGNGFLTTENLNSELQAIFNNEETVIDKSDYYIYKTNKSYTISKDGKIEERLPKEYQEVEYIESTGTQYIDTEVIQNSNCSILYDASIKYDSETGIFGCYSNRRQGFGICQFNWKGNYYIAKIENKGTAGGYISNTIDNMWNNRHIFLLEDNSLFIDNNLIDSSNPDYVINTTSCYLFGMSGSTFSNKSSQKLYVAKLYDENKIIVRNFIPCKRKSDNKPGLYDTVEGKFYTNQGSGDDFITGDDV